jgi:hypothetical protein
MANAGKQMQIVALHCSNLITFIYIFSFLIEKSLSGHLQKSKGEQCEQSVNSYTLNCSPFILLYYLSFYFSEQ